MDTWQESYNDPSSSSGRWFNSKPYNNGGYDVYWEIRYWGDKLQDERLMSEEDKELYKNDEIYVTLYITSPNQHMEANKLTKEQMIKNMNRSFGDSVVSKDCNDEDFYYYCSEYLVDIEDCEEFITIRKLATEQQLEIALEEVKFNLRSVYGI